MPRPSQVCTRQSSRLTNGRVAALSEPADAPGLSRLAGHLGLLALTGAAVLMLPGVSALPAMLAHGIVLIFLFAPLHECIHRTAFRTRRLNDAVAAVAGFLLLLPPAAFRYYHFAHHRHTQDPGRDPELAPPKPATRAAYLARLTGWSTWTAQAKALLDAALGRPLPEHVPPRGAPTVRREARLWLALYAAVTGAFLAAGSTLALELWVLPALLGQPVLRAYLLAEHTACPMVPDMLANTRTTFTQRAIRWLAWEMPWHPAHHVAPTVPFHRLPELSAALETRLKSTALGYPDAHRQILATLPR